MTVQADFKRLESQLRSLKRRKGFQEARQKWATTLRTNADRRSATHFKEIASGQNLLLLGSLTLFGTAFAWIIGDMIHWTLGILFGIAGAAIGLFVTLRVAFNATLLSSQQLTSIAEAASARLNKLSGQIPLLEAELDKLKPLVEAEIQHEKQMQLALIQERNDQLARQQLQAEFLKQLRATGTPPTPKQLRFAKHLGMRLTGKESREEISFLIDVRLSQQTPEEEAASKARWAQAEANHSRKEIRDLAIQEVDFLTQTNRDLKYNIYKGVVIIRGAECGKTSHGRFMKLTAVVRDRSALPPFNDCNSLYCSCSVEPVVEGETPRQVLRLLG